jgi:polyvinyl alcohol dehydrogenase (cytochrome)
MPECRRGHGSVPGDPGPMRNAGKAAALACASFLTALLPVAPSSSAPAGATGAGAKAAHPACATGHGGGEWRMYGHDYHNTRSQPAEKRIGPPEAIGLQPAWTFSTNGKGDFTGTPIVADGCMYVASNEGWAFAVNADTGERVWRTKLSEGVNSSLAVAGGRVYAAISHVGTPSVAALDQDTGRTLWRRVITSQPGSDVYSSPVVFEGMVFSGFSGGSAELGDDADRARFQGGFVLLSASNGRLLKRTWTIRPPDKDPDKPRNGFAGGAIWATPAIDVHHKLAFVGSGNPFRPQKQHRHTDSILKIDLDRASPRFGEIIDSYQGIVDEYIEQAREAPCFDLPGNPPPYYPQGVGSCADLDLDFGSSPNIFFDPKGRMVVGEGQKSGWYHVVNARTMKLDWRAPVGPPSAVGGIVGATAYDGTAVYGPITAPGYLWSLRPKEGTPRWFSPIADGAHWGNPVAVANGVVYIVDLKGFFDAYDAATGAPLLHRPMMVDSRDLSPSWAGVSIARHTVYAAVGITGLPNGYVIAYRPGR